MYEMFLSSSGQSGGSLSSVHLTHVISCSKADADQLKHREETFKPVIKLTCRLAGCAMAHLWLDRYNHPLHMKTAESN